MKALASHSRSSENPHRWGILTLQKFLCARPGMKCSEFAFTKKRLFYSSSMSAYFCLLWSLSLSLEKMNQNRIQGRVYELFCKAAMSGPSHHSSRQHEPHFVFFHKPDKFLDSYDGSGRVGGLCFEKTVLKGIFSFMNINCFHPFSRLIIIFEFYIW